MRKRIPFARRRKFKPTSTRKHSLRDLAVFEFLWMWKVATTPMLKETAFKGKSDWWAYKALRQLRQEKYITLLPRGRNVEQELWTLTEHGFEVFLMDRDDIKEYRYRVHAPSHDFLGTCLQLGDFWLSPVEKTFFTEQMLASLSPSNFPRSFRQITEHVPDGITILAGGVKEAIIGYEVDLNLKDEERYRFTFDYYTTIQPHLVVWLVRNAWIADRIRQATTRNEQAKLETFDKKFVFILTDDFKENVWRASVIGGPYKGMSLRKMHANLLQSLGKTTANFGQKEMKAIFFPKFRSPQKLTTYKDASVA